jgi:hypothetical protein
VPETRLTHTGRPGKDDAVRFRSCQQITQDPKILGSAGEGPVRHEPKSGPGSTISDSLTAMKRVIHSVLVRVNEGLLSHVAMV